MYRIKMWLLILTAFMALTACSPNQQIKANDAGPLRADVSGNMQATLRVLYVEADGFAYRNSAGDLTGVTVEIMREFVQWFERYHSVSLELEFVEETNWSTFYRRIQDAQGGVFGLGNVTITESRRDELQFSPPYMTNVAVLITPENTPELSDLSELANMFSDLQPMAFAGTLHETRITALRDQYQPDMDIRPATSNPEIINAVAEGGYYSYIDAYNYWRAVAEGAAIRHHSVGDDPGETFGIIMPHSNDWAPVLTAFFAADGGFIYTDRYRAIMTEHLGEALTQLLLEARS